MIRHILVPLDGSRFAEHALRRAMSLATRTESALHLVAVAIPYARVGSEANGRSAGEPTSASDAAARAAGDRPVVESRDRVQARVRKYLEDVAARMKAAGFSGGIERSALPPGNVVRSLVREVTEKQIDLVVMTTHGRGPIERAWLGSTADGFIRHAASPVLLLRPHDENAAVDLARPVSPFSRVLVPLDGSPAAERLVPLADDVAGPAAAMVFFRAVAPLAPATHYMEPVVQEHWDYEAALEDARNYLAQLADRTGRRPGSVTLEVETALSPAQVILDVAEEKGVDLIAMSTSGRGGVARLLMGSVADKVVRGSTVPLLLFREPPTGEH